MPSRPLLIAAGVGVCLAVAAAVALNQPHHSLPPAFAPAADPYPSGIYANGIIESEQTSGENVNIVPEVSGPVRQVFVAEGQRVRAGEPLLAIDDSVPRATAEQQRLQAQAAEAGVAELHAEPRPETLAVATAQLQQAEAGLKVLVDTRDKVQRSASLDPRSVSRDAVDQAVDAARAQEAAVAVARRQLDLIKAGAWRYDIATQQAQAQALGHAYQASAALLGKYVVKAPADGVVLAVNAAPGGYVSPSGAYNAYTQANQPAIVLGPGGEGRLAVRCFVDEILLGRLPANGRMEAEMIVRGSDQHVPLTFVRIQPYVTPKIELSDQRQERVDVRVLPVIFSFRAPSKSKLYPGQMVDVYIRQK